MSELSLVEYQNFLKICARFHAVNTHYYQLAQESLEGLRSSMSRSAFLSRNLRGSCYQVLGRVFRMNQYYALFFKHLSEDAAHCEGNAIDAWFCYLILEDQQNLYHFLALYYSKIDDLVLKLRAYYTNNKFNPDFYCLEYFKKILDILKTIHQEQWNTIQGFHRTLVQCRGPRKMRGSEQLRILIQYCHLSASIVQIFNRKLQDDPKNPSGSSKGGA